MPKDVKKFVNPSFTRTAPLEAMRLLLERHRDKLHQFDFASFERDPEEARIAVERFFTQAEETYPPDLVVDLHRVAELGDQTGLELLCQHAQRLGVELTAPHAATGRDDPKHVALWTFLEQPEIFEAAANVVAFFRKAGIAEFAANDPGVEAQLDEEGLAAFEQAMERVFETDRRGRYCKVVWYEDGDEITLVATFGAPITTTPIIDDQRERVINFREARFAHLSYSSSTGRLKLADVPPARRCDVAESFAACVLERLGLFSGSRARRLYTLAPIEAGRSPRRSFRSCRR